MKTGLPVFPLFLAAMLASLSTCATAPEEGSGGSAVVGGTATQAGAAGSSADVAALQKHLDDYYEKLDQGAIGEGILSLVTILSEVDRARTVSDDARQFARTADEELARIASALSLSAGIEWMGSDKNQVVGSTLTVGSPSALNPSVTLTFNYGGTRALVSGAPVTFEFVKGAGVLVTPVTTNEYGQANTTIMSLDDGKAESIVRATVSFRVKGFEYTFRAASRDFAYVPPVNRAAILVLERGIRDNGDAYLAAEPVILDRAFNVLKKVDFAFSPFSGKIPGSQYERVFGGDSSEIRALGLEEGVSYLVMVLNDAYYVKQVELNGKKYNLFKSKTNATTRVIRTADGAILYSGTVQGVDGQGNTEDKAFVDGFRAAADRMALKLEGDLQEISRALHGG